MNKQEKREKMLSLVEDWESSGLTQHAFCALHGIRICTLSYWIARSKESEVSSGGFISLSPAHPELNDQTAIIYSGGVRLKARSDLSLISRLTRL